MPYFFISEAEFAGSLSGTRWGGTAVACPLSLPSASRGAGTLWGLGASLQRRHNVGSSVWALESDVAV